MTTQPLWTWGGKFFGFRDGDNLWTHDGIHVGRFHGEDVFGRNGNYLGELKSQNRLIHYPVKRNHRTGSFAPYARRVAYVPYVNYVGYVMYAGYRDFPFPSEFRKAA